MIQQLDAGAAVRLVRTIARLSTFAFSEKDAISVSSCLTKKELLVTVRGQRSKEQLEAALALWTLHENGQGDTVFNPFMAPSVTCPCQIVPFTSMPRTTVSVFMSIPVSDLPVYIKALAARPASEGETEGGRDMLELIKERALEWQAWTPQHHEVQS